MEKTEHAVSNPERILAVIVTYEPDPDLLDRLLSALAPQVSQGIIVNNGETLPPLTSDLPRAGFAVKHLHSNQGVATALNVGMAWAVENGASFVITMDQDSEPGPDMVLNLIRGYHKLLENDQRVGAVGPQQIDRRTGERAPFVAPIKWTRRRLKPNAGEIVKVDHLITSGCLIPVDAWADAGPFLEPLFIDYVDIEWCIRLRSRGWGLFGVADAFLLHAIGEKIIRWAGRTIKWHSPLRHYFLFRNGLYLQKLPYIPITWKISDGWQLCKKLIFFTLASKPSLPHLWAMLQGARDGAAGRMGFPQNQDW